MVDSDHVTISMRKSVFWPKRARSRQGLSKPHPSMLSITHGSPCTVLMLKTNLRWVLVESGHDPEDMCLTSRYESTNWCRNERLCRCRLSQRGSAEVLPVRAFPHLTSSSTCRAYEVERFSLWKAMLTASSYPACCGFEGMRSARILKRIRNTSRYYPRMQRQRRPLLMQITYLGYGRHSTSCTSAWACPSSFPIIHIVSTTLSSPSML
jgi:hypothetical protein